MDKKQAQELIQQLFTQSFDLDRYQHFLRNLLNHFEARDGHYTGNYIPDCLQAACQPVLAHRQVCGSGRQRAGSAGGRGEDASANWNAPVRRCATLPLIASRSLRKRRL